MLFIGTMGMLVLTVGLVLFIIFHQRKVARYQRTLQKMEEEQQKILLDASIRLQEEERQRLAADLHDDAGPLLATARLYLNENLVNQDKATQLQAIFQARQIIDDTIQLVRNISHSLMPPTLKNFGLESAINDVFQKISGSGSMNASSRFHDYKDRLKPEKELIIFRIVQEQLNNTIKHAEASEVQIAIMQKSRLLQVTIADDGKGFDTTRKRKGIGITNIISRTELFNGRVKINSSPGNGCRMQVSFTI